MDRARDGMAPAMIDLSALSAHTAASRIRDGSLSAERYAAALIERHRRLAMLKVAISFDEALVLEQARAVDLARARGAVLGPLAGLPFVAKDQIDTVGYPTTAGTPALRNYRPTRDGSVVAAMRRAGAILFAKANMHELASGGTSSNPTFGFVRNPYDPSRSPGGSSGGTAAAIAARIVPIGLGEDTGGSVRIPAGFCGIAGLRPSTWPKKLYGDDGMVPPPAPDDTQTIGPMARTVAEVALLHGAITGKTVPAMPALAGVRIGVPAASFWDDPRIDQAVARVTRAAFARLAAAGATLVEVDLDILRRLGTELSAVVSTGSRDRFAAWLTDSMPGLTLEALVEQIASRDVRAAFAKAAPSLQGTAAQRAALRADANRRYAEMMRTAGVAALAFPNPLIPAPPIAPQGDPEEPMVEVTGQSWPLRDIALRYEIFGSRLGVPGLNLPVGQVEGLPVGLELEGLPGGDEHLLALGMAVEALFDPLPPPAL